MPFRDFLDVNLEEVMTILVVCKFHSNLIYLRITQFLVGLLNENDKEFINFEFELIRVSLRAESNKVAVRLLMPPPVRPTPAWAENFGTHHELGCRVADGIQNARVTQQSFELSRHFERQRKSPLILYFFPANRVQFYSFASDTVIFFTGSHK